MNEVVFHNKWFYYEDPDTSDIYKIKYKTYISLYSTLIFEIQTTKKKYSIFGIGFGPMIKTYKRIFSSRDMGFGEIIDLDKTYDVNKTKYRVMSALDDYKKSALYKQTLIISDKLKHSEFLGNKTFIRDSKIDSILKK
jgi:hypothetical protein